MLFAKFYSNDGNSINTKVLAHFFENLKDGSEESLLKKIVVEEPAEGVTPVEDVTPTEDATPTEDVTPAEETSSTSLE